MSDSLFDLSGKVALVTGTSRGLGQYFARALARAGADLAITSRDKNSLSAFASEIHALGRKTFSVDLDVRDHTSIQQAIAAIDAHFGKIDILVNNAGCNIRTPALDVTCVAGYAGLGPYGASRGGIRQLTMSLADDWGSHGVTVNCLAPGWFKTQQNKVLYENAAWVEYISDRIPVKRPGLPDDLDGAIVFLASESSRYITGQTLLVDGGISTGAAKATV